MHSLPDALNPSIYLKINLVLHSVQCRVYLSAATKRRVKGKIQNVLWKVFFGCFSITC